LNTDLAPVREEVEAGRVGHLGLSCPIGVHDPELEPTAHGPMEHDLAAIERPCGSEVADRSDLRLGQDSFTELRDPASKLGVGARSELFGETFDLVQGS